MDSLAKLPQPPVESEAVDAEVLDDQKISFARHLPWEEPFPQFPPGAYPYGPLAPTRPKGKTYAVPKRLSMAALLAIMTALPFLFGGLRFLEAPPVIYLFLGTLVMIISLAQMFFGRVPRQASVAVGAVLLPPFLLGAFLAYGSDPYGPNLFEGICLAVVCIPMGGFVGYLAGACTAGIFLLMETLEPFLPGGNKPVSTTATERGSEMSPR